MNAKLCDECKIVIPPESGFYLIVDLTPIHDTKIRRLKHAELCNECTTKITNITVKDIIDG